MRTRDLTGPRRIIHSLRFEAPDQALRAVRELKASGYEVVDVFSPFPLHGVDGLLGLPETKLPFATLIGGALGLGGGLWLQMWTHSVAWPVDIGGKDFLAWPGTIPIAFETTVLLAAVLTVITFFAATRLFPRPSAKREQPHPGVTDDAFVVLVAEQDGAFHEGRFRKLVAELGPAELVERWRIE